MAAHYVMYITNDWNGSSIRKTMCYLYKSWRFVDVVVDTFHHIEGYFSLSFQLIKLINFFFENWHHHNFLAKYFHGLFIRMKNVCLVLRFERRFFCLWFKNIQCPNRESTSQIQNWKHWSSLKSQEFKDYRIMRRCVHFALDDRFFFCFFFDPKPHNKFY